MTVRDTQMVRDQKKFENHWFRGNVDSMQVQAALTAVTDIIKGSIHPYPSNVCSQ